MCMQNQREYITTVYLEDGTCGEFDRNLDLDLDRDLDREEDLNLDLDLDCELLEDDDEDEEDSDRRLRCFGFGFGFGFLLDALPPRRLLFLLSPLLSLPLSSSLLLFRLPLVLDRRLTSCLAGDDVCFESAVGVFSSIAVSFSLFFSGFSSLTSSSSFCFFDTTFSLSGECDLEGED